MFEIMKNLEQSKWTFALGFAVAVFAMAVALFFQYGLKDEPCVLCIHIRIIVCGLGILCLLGFFLARFEWLRVLSYGALFWLVLELFWKSEELYLIEQGLKNGECLFSAGLPSWFNLEAWLPSIFEVRALCGTSPNVLGGMSMAQMLYYSSVFAVIALLVLLCLSIVGRIQLFNSK